MLPPREQWKVRFIRIVRYIDEVRNRCLLSYDYDLGAILCLDQEVSPLGIQTCTLVPGHFRTEIIAPERAVFGARDIPDYAAANEMVEAGIRGMHQKQLGDPKAAAIRIVDAVRGEGEAAGKALPAVLPLGQDAVDGVRKRCKAVLEACDEWEAFAGMTTTEHL